MVRRLSRIQRASLTHGIKHSLTVFTHVGKPDTALRVYAPPFQDAIMLPSLHLISSGLTPRSPPEPQELTALVDAFLKLRDPQARRRLIAAAEAEAARAADRNVIASTSGGGPNA